MDETPRQLDAPSYASRIEERFRELRGRPLFLSPADYRRAIAWHERGVPLRLVLESLEGLFARARERDEAGPRSLRYCEPAIKEAFKEWSAAHAARRAFEQDAAPEPSAAEAELDEAKALLEEAAAAVEASEAPTALRSELAAELRRLGEAPPEDGEESEALLTRLDTRLVEGTRATLEREALAALEEEVRAELAALLTEMSEEDAEEALARGLSRRLRRRFRLPDLGMLAYELG